MYQVKHCKYVATELKIGEYIFDAIGTDGSDVYIIEAKQAIDDFKADCNKKEDIRKNIDEYKKMLIESGDVKKYSELIEKEREKSYKFDDQALCRLSNYRYVIAPENMIPKTDVPENWGLIEVNAVGDVKKEVECPPAQTYDKRFREIVIREIARRNSFIYLKEVVGVNFEEKTTVFPKLVLE